jgi:hypothetical protein
MGASYWAADGWKLEIDLNVKSLEADCEVVG